VGRTYVAKTNSNNSNNDDDDDDDDDRDPKWGELMKHSLWDSLAGDLHLKNSSRNAQPIILGLAIPLSLPFGRHQVNEAGYTVIFCYKKTEERKRHQQTDGGTHPLVESLRRD